MLAKNRARAVEVLETGSFDVLVRDFGDALIKPPEPEDFVLLPFSTGVDEPVGVLVLQVRREIVPLLPVGVPEWDEALYVHHRLAPL